MSLTATHVPCLHKDTIKEKEEELKDSQNINIEEEEPKDSQNFNNEEESINSLNANSEGEEPNYSKSFDNSQKELNGFQNEEEELVDFKNTNFSEEEESKNYDNSNFERRESNNFSDNNYFYNEEEQVIEPIATENYIEEEEEDNFTSIEEPIFEIDSDIDYSDSEYDLINDIFDENRPKVIVRRDYLTDLDKKSVRSMRSSRSSRSNRSNRSIKKRHISKIQKYNVTRPFVKTTHFDTTPNPDNDEFKEEQEPIRYTGHKSFLKRQTKSNEHRVELRSQEPTERGFDPPLYTKEKSPKNTHKKTDLPYIYKTTKNPSPIKANSYLDDLFKTSVKKPPVIVEEPLPEMYKVNQTSEDLAKAKNQELIEFIAGKDKTISEIKFVSIMRRFNISNVPEPSEPFVPRPLICKIKDIIKLDDGKYDNVKLKELLISAFIGQDNDEIINELRPPVLAALSNIRPSYVLPRKNLQNSKSQKSPKNASNSQSATKTQRTKSSTKTDSISKQKKNPNNASSTPKNSNKDIDNNQNKILDDVDYTTDEEIINTKPSKQKAKSKTPQKKSNPVVPANQAETPKAKTVKSHKTKNIETPEPVEKEEASKGKGKRRHRKRKNEDQNSQREPDLNDSDMESKVLPEKEEKKVKKNVRPKPPTSRGAKYFPGFYDNLDFFKNKPPSQH